MAISVKKCGGGLEGGGEETEDEQDEGGTKFEESKHPSACPTSPLPLPALVALSSALFVHSLVVTVLFPFAPVMVESFHVAENAEQSGYYAGLLSSAYFCGSLIAGPLWGCLSDRLGRKPVVLIGLVANALFGSLFGLSTNLTTALSLRFILGLFCTVFIAAKTALTELCDDTNQAEGFAAFGLCWALGIILGPVLGGVLAEPASKFPAAISSTGVFAVFPFLLPCITLGALNLVAGLLCCFCLPETLRRSKIVGKVKQVLEEGCSSRDEESVSSGTVSIITVSSSRSSSLSEVVMDGQSEEGGESNHSKGEEEAERQEKARRSGRSNEDVIMKLEVVKFGKESDEVSMLKTPLLFAEDSREREDCKTGTGEGLKKMGVGEKTLLLGKTEGEEEDPGFFRVVFCDPDTLMTGAIFCLCGFMPVAFDALFPMWSLSDWSVGGLGFTTTNLGMAQAASGVSLIPMTLVIYPWLVHRLGAICALQLSLATGIVQACTPLVRLLTHKYLVEIACIVIFAIRSFNMTGMAAMFILTANSVRYPKYMGAVNGMLATVQNVVQAIAPTATGAVFGWSSHPGAAFPFDYHLTWIILGACHLLLLALTFFLPEHINRRKFQS
eukprot:TRINITY_DN8260_c0_g1_i1.p1 TRINITY_DN8260_c0_g1~~TRINITY_DN8260_c0_g1_i1.p1  ORF type:complete len:613 (-),score=123.45 TRINITY_DN8260_c0_g1_i1:941-2779(-)